MERLLLEAYLNELGNDVAGKTLTQAQRGTYDLHFLYKNYKVNHFSDVLYNLFCFTSMFFVKFWFLWYLVILIKFLVSMLFRTKNRSDFGMDGVGFITSINSKKNISLVYNKNIEYLDRSYLTLCYALTLKEKSVAFLLSIKFITYIFTNKYGLSSLEKSSVKLHALDLFEMAMFIQVSKKICALGLPIYLDCHYERWAYIASKIPKLKLVIVQHGYLRSDIPFKFSFGNIDILYVYDKLFLAQFKNYFSCVNECRLIKPKLELINKKEFELTSVFIASSMISIAYELELIELLLKKGGFRIYVKLHPAYRYKNRFKHYNDRITFIDYFPAVDFMVTYNSFLGYEYHALDQKVIWLKERKTETALDLMSN